MAADSDKNKMSRLLNLARKFNCFYLSGNFFHYFCEITCRKNRKKYAWICVRSSVSWNGIIWEICVVCPESHTCCAFIRSLHYYFIMIYLWLSSSSTCILFNNCLKCFKSKTQTSVHSLIAKIRDTKTCCVTKSQPNTVTKSCHLSKFCSIFSCFFI